MKTKRREVQRRPDLNRNKESKTSYHLSGREPVQGLSSVMMTLSISDYYSPGLILSRSKALILPIQGFPFLLRFTLL